jgi:hypothetical protein
MGRVRALVAAVVCAASFVSAASAGPRLEFQPDRLDFGSLKQGEKRQKTVRLLNTGDTQLVIEQIRPSCAECMVDKVPVEPLAPGGQFDLPITYQATAVPGEYSAHVTFHTNASDEPLKRLYLAVKITPKGDAPGIGVEPENCDFGIVILNETVERTLRLRNTGGAALRIEEVAASPFLALEGKPPAELPVGGSCELKVRCAASAEGILRGHVTIASNDPERRTVTVPVSGYVATAGQVESAVRGVIIRPRRSEDQRRALQSVQVVNRQDLPILVSWSQVAGQRPVTVGPGESAVLGPPAPSGDEAAVVLVLGGEAAAGTVERTQ